MPSRWCECRGCTACNTTTGTHGVLYDMDHSATRKCPPCQQQATTARNARPSSSERGYDGEYQRNNPLVIAQGRNGRSCVICKKPFTAKNKITVEHIKPLRAGGTNDLANLGPAHAWCNTAWNKKR